MLLIMRILNYFKQAIINQRHRAAERELIARYGDNWKEILTR